MSRRESEEVRGTHRQVDERVHERARDLSLANQRLERALETRAEALGREQQARVAAERANELKDRFLSTVSHELRTPLNAIVGWVHLIKGGTLTALQVEHAIEAIDRNARAQARMITNLLDVSHMIQGRLTVSKDNLDLRLAIDEAVEAARAAAELKGLTVDYRRSSTEVRVCGDRVRLHQIASNLLSNAVKFTPSGGRIAVSVRADGVGFAEVQVSDTGEGIDADVLPRLFDTFFQARTNAMRAGLGLGLPIVKELVELHGGTVSVASAGRGHGATFTLRFPLIPNP